MVRTLVSVAVLCAVVFLGGGCASHRDKAQQARARGIRVPTDRSVLTGVAAAPAKPSLTVPAPTQTFIAAAPAPTSMPMPYSFPAAGIESLPRFQPVDPTDCAAPQPGYVGVQRAMAPKYTAGLGSRYLVQKGDTLFGIARSRYGDGKRWQQIASANPGLTPATLRAGATIVVP